MVSPSFFFLYSYVLCVDQLRQLWKIYTVHPLIGISLNQVNSFWRNVYVASALLLSTRVWSYVTHNPPFCLKKVLALEILAFLNSLLRFIYVAPVIDISPYRAALMRFNISVNSSVSGLNSIFINTNFFPFSYLGCSLKIVLL